MRIANVNISKNNYADDCRGEAPNFVFNAHSQLAMGLGTLSVWGETEYQCVMCAAIEKDADCSMLRSIFSRSMCYDMYKKRHSVETIHNIHKILMSKIQRHFMNWTSSK